MLIRKVMVTRKWWKELQHMISLLKQHKSLLINSEYLLVVFDRFKHVF